MSDEKQEAQLRSAAVLACKYIILKICDGFSLGLAALTGQLAEESGPFARRPDSLAISINNLCEQIGRLVFGKSHIHSVLYGDEDDKRLIDTIYAILQALKRDVRQPLETIIRMRTDESKIRPKVCALSVTTAAFHQQVQQLLIEARARFVTANAEHSSSFINNLLTREEAVEEEWTVVSVDKAAYSKGALALESLANARALLEHNRALVEQFIRAIENAGGQPSEILIHASGDGALLYFRDPNLAVKASLAVHALARANTLRMPDMGWAQQFRIGIATGPVCICRQRAFTSTTFQFEAGGATIINAVRIEAKCEPRQLWICHTTVKRLNRALQDCFSEPERIETKSHEERSIVVCKYCF